MGIWFAEIAMSLIAIKSAVVEMDELMLRIRKKLLHLRLQPIRVFCFHQVSDVFDPETMWECDFMPMEQFKNKVMSLREQYTFISLTEAHHHIANDKVRTKKYAVLTIDDAGDCIVQLMPWLADLRIPITLFVPPAFVLGEVKNHRYGRSLTKVVLDELLQKYPSLISLGNHGWNHVACSKLSIEEFVNDVTKADQFLDKYHQNTPFYAYPFGRCSWKNDGLLWNMHKIPVYVDGMKNYNDAQRIHRELL